MTFFVQCLISSWLEEIPNLLCQEFSTPEANFLWVGSVFVVDPLCAKHGAWGFSVQGGDIAWGLMWMTGDWQEEESGGNSSGP